MSRTHTPRVRAVGADREGRGPGVAAHARRTPLALRDLERIASQTGLAHVFGDLPYPDDDVLARWALLLDDPEVTVEVVEDDGGWSPSPPTTATRCGTWPSAPTTGARGLGREGFLRAEAAGARRLWVLEANGRARGLYESLGWAPTGATQECPWAPYPTEVEYAAP